MDLEENTDLIPSAILSGLGLGMYFWGTDFAFEHQEIWLPILNRNVSSEPWYGVNTGILALAYANIIRTGYLQGKNRKRGSLKKGLTLTAASSAASILSYVTITQSLIYEHTGNLGGLAKIVTQLHPLAEKTGLSMQRSFDVWNLCVYVLAASFLGLYLGVRELSGYVQHRE